MRYTLSPELLVGLSQLGSSTQWQALFSLRHVKNSLLPHSARTWVAQASGELVTAVRDSDVCAYAPQMRSGRNSSAATVAHR